MRPYSVLGLRLHASDVIPCLPESADSAPVDVRVWLQRTPSWLTAAQAGDSRVRYVSPH